jgi:hypothetical protein
MPGVNINRRREIALPDTDITTPYGTNITVTSARAEALLARPGIRLGDGSLRRYMEGHNADTLIAEIPTGAKPPRTGSRANTPEE